MIKLEMVKLEMLVPGFCCDEAGDGEAEDDKAGDDEAGDDEAGDDEAGDDEAGDDKAADGEAQMVPLSSASSLALSRASPSLWQLYHPYDSFIITSFIILVTASSLYYPRLYHHQLYKA